MSVFQRGQIFKDVGAFAGDDRDRFFAEMDRFTTSWDVLKNSRTNDVKWCHPKLVLEVKHLAGSKLLRHAGLVVYDWSPRQLVPLERPGDRLA